MPRRPIVIQKRQERDAVAWDWDATTDDDAAAVPDQGASPSSASSSRVRRSNSNSKSRAESTKSTKSRRPKKQPRPSAASGGPLLGVALLGALGAGAWFAWRWWRNRSSNSAERAGETQGRQRSNAAASTSKAGNTKKPNQSAFSFDKHSHQAKSKPQAPAPPPAPQLTPSNCRGSGNPKKDKALRKQRKEQRKAQKGGPTPAKTDATTALIAQRAEKTGLAEAARADQQKEPQRETYVDYEKVAEGYTKILDWQETGKKRY